MSTIMVTILGDIYPALLGTQKIEELSSDQKAKVSLLYLIIISNTQYSNICIQWEISAFYLI